MKRKKKEITLPFVLMLVAVFSFAQNLAADPMYSFIVWFHNGGKVSFSLDDRPVITYNNGYVIVSSIGNRVECPHEQIHKFTFSDGTNSPGNDTAVDAVGQDVQVQQQQQSMVFSGCVPGENVNIYNMAGQLVSKHEINSDGTLFVSLQRFGKGMYVVKMKSLTYKFIKE